MTAKSWKYLSALLITWLIIGGAVVLRHFRMMFLFHVALSPTSSTAVSDDAINTLVRYHGSTATDLLIEIATSERVFVDNRQALAIKSVASRADPTALVRLTILLQPHIELGRRIAVAEAIETGSCIEECVERILHYEERAGPDNATKSETAGIFDQTVLAMIAKEEAKLNDTLNRVLIKNQKQTLLALRDIYGLGSSTPSSFGLQVVTMTHMRSACPLIASSEASHLMDADQKAKILTVMKELNCER
jgi:hypothetical protein